MHIKVTPSATKPVAHIELAGARYDVVRDDIPANLPPLIRLAAETYWKGRADGPVNYGVMLYEEN